MPTLLTLLRTSNAAIGFHAILSKVMTSRTTVGAGTLEYVRSAALSVLWRCCLIFCTGSLCYILRNVL